MRIKRGRQTDILTSRLSERYENYNCSIIEGDTCKNFKSKRRTKN